MYNLVSIIIEWENVLLADHRRAQQMLSEVGRQSAESSIPCEILMVYNPLHVDRTSLATLLKLHLLPDCTHPITPISLLEADPGLHYYSLKNFGAQQSNGNIIVFMDSDVIPEPGWLAALIQPLLDDPSVQVVGGNTYLDYLGLIGKAFALGWFFPVRQNEAVLCRSGRFFANNVAFRREVFLRHPFPALPEGATRGACSGLARALASAGIDIWTSSAAHAKHPAPNGWKHILTRGLAEGRDWILYARTEEGLASPAVSFLRPLAQVLSRPIKTAWRGWSLGPKVSLRRWQIPVAASIMGVYGLMFCLGAWCTMVKPEWTRRRWQI